MVTKELTELWMTKLQDKRLCRAYYIALTFEDFSLPLITNFDNTKECYSILNDITENDPQNADNRWQKIQDAKLYAQENLIPLSEFSWLNANERACYWAWGYIQSIDDNMLQNHYFHRNYNLPKYIYPYQQLKLNTSPTTTQHRFSLIIDFFDLIYLHVNNKLSLLKHLEDKWQTIYKGKRPFQWLDKQNEKDCEWTWEYIVKAHSSSPSISARENLTSTPAYYLKPCNANEKKLAIFAAMDLWETNPDTKTLFLKNINKAFSQRKFRERKEGSKPFNTYLKLETKVKLDELASYHDKKIVDIIDKLINDAHREIRHK